MVRKHENLAKRMPFQFFSIRLSATIHVWFDLTPTTLSTVPGMSQMFNKYLLVEWGLTALSRKPGLKAQLLLLKTLYSREVISLNKQGGTLGHGTAYMYFRATHDGAMQWNGILPVLCWALWGGCSFETYPVFKWKPSFYLSRITNNLKST